MNPENLIALGWIDGQGQSLDWKHWHKYWQKNQRLAPVRYERVDTPPSRRDDGHTTKRKEW